MDYENNENNLTEESSQQTTESEKSDKGPKIYYENIVTETQAEQKPVKVKKKRLLNTPIIIAICIVAVSVLSFLVYDIFFNTSIYGTWTFDSTTVSTDDEINTAYYTFNNDGTASVTCGNVTFNGTITISSEDNTKAVISIPNFIGEQEYNIAVTGNKLSTRHLILSSESVTGSFTSAKAEKVPVEKIKDFVIDNEIIGEWSDDYYGMSCTFNEDGTVIINQGDIMIVEAAYSTDKANNKITLKYEMAKEIDDEWSYGYDKKNDTLVLNGLGLKRVDPASADEK